MTSQRYSNLVEMSLVTLASVTSEAVVSQKVLTYHSECLSPVCGGPYGKFFNLNYY